MPKSKGRKPKKQTRSTSRRGAPIPTSAGSMQYQVGRLRGSDDAIGGLLLSGRAAPDLMIELLPPLLWLSHMHGKPANHCVDGSMILYFAYAQLGILAQPRAVDLVVSNRQTDKSVYYGRPDPFWDGTTFHGHCVLWLPRSGRLIDATVEQYPEVSRHRLGPICGRLAASYGSPEQQAAISQGELPPGSHIAVERQDLLLLYTATDHQFDQVVTSSDTVRDAAERYRRAGINLASHALTFLRLPEVVDNIRQANYRRVNALLNVLGAPVDAVVDERGDYRFTMDGGNDAGQALRLDELPIESPPAHVPTAREKLRHARRAATPNRPVAAERALREVRQQDDIPAQRTDENDAPTAAPVGAPAQAERGWFRRIVGR